MTLKDTLDILCAQLTRDLLAKFLLFLFMRNDITGASRGFSATAELLAALHSIFTVSESKCSELTCCCSEMADYN